MSERWIFAAGIVLAVLVVGGVFLLRPVKPKPAEVKEARAPAPPPITEVTLTGQIEARNVVAVAATLDGIAEEVFVDAGQEVYEGQLLCRIKNSELDLAHEAAVAEAEKAQSRASNLESSLIAARLEASRARADALRSRGEFERAEKAYQRQAILFREGATPRLVYEKAEREYNSLKSESEGLEALAKKAEGQLANLTEDLDRARRNAEKSKETLESASLGLAAAEVHSPIDGIVVERKAKAGEAVSREIKDLFRVATDLGQLSIAVEPDPTALARIHPGQPASVHVAEAPDPLTGTVREIRGTQAVIDFSSPTPLVKPGITAQVKIPLT